MLGWRDAWRQPCPVDCWTMLCQAGEHLCSSCHKDLLAGGFYYLCTWSSCPEPPPRWEAERGVGGLRLLVN